jgi:predicted anti-sigma-YlaC factor YlaD
MRGTWTCQAARDHFSDDVEDNLDERAGALLREHLSHCSECREIRDAVDEVVVALRTLPIPEHSARLPARIVAATRGARRSPTPRLHSTWTALPAAAAIVAVTSAALLTGTPAGRLLGARTRVVGERLVEHAEQLAGELQALRATAGEEAAARLERMGTRLQEYRRWRERKSGAPDTDLSTDVPPAAHRHQASDSRTSSGSPA